MDEESTQPEAVNDVQDDVSGAPTDETTQEVESTEAPETEEQPEQSEQTEEEAKPTRQEKRQSRLAQINEQLSQQPAERQQLQQQPTQQERKRLSELLQGRDEVQPEELDQIADQWATQHSGIGNVDAIVDMKLAQRDAYNNARNEVVEVMGRDEFNPDSDSYNPNLEQATLRTWEKAARVQYDQNGNVVSFDPTVSLREIADQFLEVGQSYANKKLTDTNATLSQQADEGAVTGGTQVAKSKKSFSDMSIEEMEAQLGYHKV